MFRKGLFRRNSFGGRECGRTTSSAPAPLPSTRKIPSAYFTPRPVPSPLSNADAIRPNGKLVCFCLTWRFDGIWTGAQKIFGFAALGGRFRGRTIIIGPPKKQASTVKGSYEKCQLFITCPESGMLKAFFDFCSRPRFWQRD